MSNFLLYFEGRRSFDLVLTYNGSGVNICPYFLDARQGKGFEFSSSLGKGFEVQVKSLWIFGRFLVKTPKQIVGNEKRSAANLPKYKRFLKTLNMIVNLPF